MTDLRPNLIYQSNCQATFAIIHFVVQVTFVHLRYILGGTRPK